MTIASLQVLRVRNLKHAQLTFSPRVNIICGPNGSGKTSLLEAIHLLGLARSFRSTQTRHYVQRGEQACVVSGSVFGGRSLSTAQTLGVERNLDGSHRIRFANEDMALSELAQLIPLQVIDSTTFQLLDGSPSVRRQFIDWGVFYANQSFVNLWRAFRRALKQRNSLLKCGNISELERQTWDAELVHLSLKVTGLRETYLAALTEEFKRIAAVLLPNIEFTLTFARGWDEKTDLDQVLANAFARDLKQGFSSHGPQRADLRVKADGLTAADRLSRGQKKLTVSALKLAQGALFNRMSGRTCVFLVDDLPAELDAEHGQRFCQFLEQSESQCFITCVDANSVADFWQPSTELAHFRVQSGEIERV